MRIRVSHATTYRYDTPPTGVTQIMRLTPRNHDGQYVVNWRIDLSADCLLHQHEDAFGNITHSFTAEGPFDELSVTVDGEVEMQDMHGLVNGAVERFPPALFLRETRAHASGCGDFRFCRDHAHGRWPGRHSGAAARAAERTSNREITFDTDPTQTATTAAEAFKLRRGVCQDLTHIFIASARKLGVPARYIGGHFYRADGVTAQDAGHAWAEAYVENLGWVGFDPRRWMPPPTPCADQRRAGLCRRRSGTRRTLWRRSRRSWKPRPCRPARQERRG